MWAKKSFNKLFEGTQWQANNMLLGQLTSMTEIESLVMTISFIEFDIECLVMWTFASIQFHYFVRFNDVRSIIFSVEMLIIAFVSLDNQIESDRWCNPFKEIVGKSNTLRSLHLEWL